MSKIKVLIVGAFPPKDRKIFGGVVTACKNLIASSFASKFDLSLIDSSQISNPAPSFYVRLLLAIRRFAHFCVELIKIKPDCILIFSSSGAGLLEKGLMARFAKMFKIPVLFFPRGGAVLKSYDHSLIHRLIAKSAFRTPEKILCQGKQWQEFLVNKLSRLPNDTPIVMNWTATTELLDVGTRRIQKVHSHPLKILFVGWIEQEKGVMDLLNAYLLLSDRPNVKLVFVGNGSFIEKAKQFTVEKKIQDYVEFRGWLEGDDLSDAYESADIFVLPSWLEGMPNSMIEAMAARLPVIVTPVGNIPSVIENGVNGLLVEPKSPQFLAAAIEALILNRELRDNISNNGYETAKLEFGVERAANKLSEIIESVARLHVEGRQQEL